MSPDDIEKLMGGYAAGTLTPGERQALFEAALEDQQLFEGLAAEEPLREMLQDPVAKAQLLAALDHRPAPWYRRLAWPAFGTVAAAAMVLMAVFGRHEPPKPEPVVVAETRREPVRSFQPVLPVEKSPLPTALQSKPLALPAPPQLPAAAPLAAPLDATAPAAPPAPAAQNAAEASSFAAADSESAKAKAQILPTAGAPAFRALNLVNVASDAAAAARVGLHYTIYKKSPAGVLTEVGPETELERSDEVVIGFESNAPGFLSVSQLDTRNGLIVLANESLQPSVPYMVPSNGSLRPNGAGPNNLMVRFTRQSQNALKRAPAAAGQAGAVTSPEPGAATFNITLKYK